MPDKKQETKINKIMKKLKTRAPPQGPKKTKVTSDSEVTPQNPGPKKQQSNKRRSEAKQGNAREDKQSTGFEVQIIIKKQFKLF